MLKVMAEAKKVDVKLAFYRSIFYLYNVIQKNTGATPYRVAMWLAEDVKSGE